MTARKRPHWPPRPSTAACHLEGLTMAMADIVHQEGAGGIAADRRTYLALSAIAAAAEIHASELSHWFGSRMGEEHERLEELQDGYDATG